MTEYLRPKVASQTGQPSKRKMENGIFRNPPEYTALGGFTSESKLTNPSGFRYRIGAPSLEKGGPSAQKNKPV